MTMVNSDLKGLILRNTILPTLTVLHLQVRTLYRNPQLNHSTAGAAYIWIFIFY